MVRKGVASAAGKTDGQFLALTGAVLLVGPLKQTEAEQLVSPINAALVGNVNPFAGKLRVVVTPFIQDNAWYMFSDPAVLANFVFGFLRGATGPRVRMDETFGYQSLRYTVEHDFGCGAVGYRAGWKNAGA